MARSIYYCEELKIDPDGKFRMVRRGDQLYVVGDGNILPADDEEDAKRLIAAINAEESDG